MNKAIKKIVKTQNYDVPIGIGTKLSRTLGNEEFPDLDPFLLLDHFKLKLPQGFPDHPHRGLETLTYMFDGTFYHEDFKGHKGEVTSGGGQWMAAGKGIFHAEMPGSWDHEAEGL